MAQITYRQALHDTLREELQRDENIFLMGEEIGNFEGSYKITAGLLKEFGPRRVVDTPICENGLVGMATGAAMLGLRPVVEIMTINFIVLAMDEIVNHAAKIYAMFGGQCPIPLVIRTPGGANAAGQNLTLSLAGQYGRHGISFCAVNSPDSFPCDERRSRDCHGV